MNDRPAQSVASCRTGRPRRADRPAPGTTILAVILGVWLGALAFSAAASDIAIPDEPASLSTLRRVLTLHDYNTRVVVLGAGVLGAAGGGVGVLLLLRQRALVGDTLAHATLPGIAAAFLLAAAAGAAGKQLPLLLTGATLSATAAGAAVLGLRHMTRLKEDAALGVVLSVCFGLGVALLGIAQKMPQAQAAGLESFIYGKTASMLASDAQRIAVVAILAATVIIGLLKEWRLLCFDQAFAASLGRPIWLMDLLLMGLATLVTVVGLQAVGLILITALLIIPAAAARFWTRSLGAMVVLASLLGAASAATGAAVSAVAARLPSGALIVLTASVFFAVSFLLAPDRGLLARRIRLHRVRVAVGRGQAGTP